MREPADRAAIDAGDPQSETGAATAAAARDVLYAPHFDGRRYFNPWGRLPVHFRDVLRWYRERPWRRPPESPAPHVHNDGSSLRAPEPGVALTWVGHATFAIHHRDTMLLTDPQWSHRALLPPRHVPPGLPLAALPSAPIALVSHNHYDHLDRATVRRLPAGTRWLVPLGLARTLRRWGARDVAELDWWQACDVDGVRFTCVPAQHWSNRVLTPRNASLWCGWTMVLGGRTLYFSGDSGHHAPLCVEIARRCGPLDVALLPIGAYEPRWFMRYQHMNPEEAVAALAALHARYLLAMHWGTFVLTDEPLDEPPRALRRAAAAAGIADERLIVLAVGERWRLP